MQDLYYEITLTGLRLYGSLRHYCDFPINRFMYKSTKFINSTHFNLIFAPTEKTPTDDDKNSPRESYSTLKW